MPAPRSRAHVAVHDRVSQRASLARSGVAPAHTDQSASAAEALRPAYYEALNIRRGLFRLEWADRMVSV